MSLTPYDLFFIIFTFIFLLKISHHVRFYVKMIVYMVSSMLLASVPIPLMLLRIGDYRNALVPAKFLVTVAKIFLGVTYEVRGLENVKKDHGSVILINHQSSIDLIILAVLWPLMGRTTVVSKKEVLYLFPFGFAAYLWGTLFIDRSNRKAALNSINEAAKVINDKQGKLLFFPEGTRNHSFQLLPFKKGAFNTAIHSQCPIQPIVVSHYYFFDAGKKIFDSGRAIIHILPEIPTVGYSIDTMDKLMDVTHSVMQKEFTIITNEIRSELESDVTASKHY